MEDEAMEIIIVYLSKSEKISQISKDDINKFKQRIEEK